VENIFSGKSGGGFKIKTPLDFTVFSGMIIV
jgi:hypothetical protein